MACTKRELLAAIFKTSGRLIKLQNRNSLKNVDV